MTGWVPWLAQVNGLGGGELVPPTASKATTLLANDAALVVLAGLCLTLLFAPWAVRIWRNTGRRHRKFKDLADLAVPRPAGLPGAVALPRPLAAPGAPSSPFQRITTTTQPPAPPAAAAARASRRRVRAHRPRNPTLAEIGGLPPLRPASGSPPAAP